jgi:hypothetical protein
VYEQLLREGSVNGWLVACRTVERLMRARDLAGVMMQRHRRPAKERRS